MTDVTLAIEETDEENDEDDEDEDEVKEVMACDVSPVPMYLN